MYTIEKTLSQAINRKLQLIGDHFTGMHTGEPYLNNFSLIPGRAGCMLVQGMFLQHTGDTRYRESLLQTEALLVNKINITDPLPAIFCDGLAGWGWLMLHLKTQGILPEFDETILEDVDALLEQSVDTLLQNGNYDLFYGALGVGVYFLKRKQYQLAAKILTHFAATAVEDEREIKWPQFRPVPEAAPRYDFGLPHGMAGILYFIHKCYQANVLPDVCEKLLQKSIRFFLNNLQDESTIRSFFPYWVECEKYGTDRQKPVRSRLAWCYGDLTILYTLMQVAKTLQDPALENSMLEMLLKTCTRTTVAATDVDGAGFCHGTSGLAYLYMKFFKQTGHPLFKETAEHWYQKTCELGDKEGPAGYLIHTTHDTWEVNSGLLEGLGGIALSFLAYTYPDAPDHWDECLFLS